MSLGSVAQSDIDNSQWRPFVVTFDKGNFQIFLDHQLRLEYDDEDLYQTRMSGNRFGFGARTGLFNNSHRVRNMEWSQLIATTPTSDGRGVAQYAWTEDGAYGTKLRATVTTAEGLSLGDTEGTTVIVEAGRPTAMPGGPYRGGIAGGNFSPIQFEGNPPGFVEADDIGEIQDWQWFFDGTDFTGHILSFDGVDDYVSVENLAGFAPTSFSVAWWINPSTQLTNWNQRIGTSTWGEFMFHTTFDGGIYVGTDIATRFTPSDLPASTLVLNQWQHFAFTFDANDNGTDGTAKFYKDGVELASKPNMTLPQTWSGFFIGSPVGGTIHGSVDNVSVWNRALSVQEVQGAMTGLVDNDPDLKGYWTFDEGTGNITEDRFLPGNNGTLINGPTWDAASVPVVVNGIWNPAQAYPQAGVYDVSLRVQSEFGKWSSSAPTNVTLISGKITGSVRAADLRTPVQGVTLTLTSSHVDPGRLALIAVEDNQLTTTGDGGIQAITNVEGFYTFEGLPLGSYRIAASKGSGDNAHDFETVLQATEMTLDAPNQLAIDFVDLSVFPVGGRVVYSIQKNGVDVLVEGVEVKAQPIGSTSDIEAPLSTKSLSATSTNYSLPLFAGKYLFLAKRTQHDIRIKEDTPGYDSNTQLLTIEDARNDIDFVDYTTRTITVFVEDSGGFPIDITLSTDVLFRDPFSTHEADLLASTIPTAVQQTGSGLSLSDSATMSEDGENRWRIVDEGNIYILKKEADDLVGYQASLIQALVTGTNGLSQGDVTLSGSQISFVATVPPGTYTVRLPNVPDAVVKSDKSQSQAEVDVTGGDASITMVVPVPIELVLSAPPNLQDVMAADPQYQTLEELGLSLDAEGFMVYYPPQLQEHAYIITATANGEPVRDFTLFVTDEVSQITPNPPSERRFASVDIIASADELAAGESNIDENKVVYPIRAGLPKLNTGFDPPVADTKGVEFRAEKDGYKPSASVSDAVTVLGDFPVGEATLLATPNVNYLALHDPPGDNSYAYLEDSFLSQGMQVFIELNEPEEDGSPRVYPSPWNPTDGDAGSDGKIRQPRSGDVDVVVPFSVAAAIELASGAALSLSPGLVSYAVAVAKFGVNTAVVATETFGQYEVSVNRRVQTPDSDAPALVGPGKGDVYFGEGLTVTTQDKYRLGIENIGSDADPDWELTSALIPTFSVTDRSNQYLYTIGDIKNIIANTGRQKAAETDSGMQSKMQGVIDGWQGLLDKNLAYEWTRYYVGNAHKISTLQEKQEAGEMLSAAEQADLSKLQAVEANIVAESGAFEVFKQAHSNLPDEYETLLFSAGPAFEYSRTIAEGTFNTYESSVSAETSGAIGREAKAGLDLSTFGIGVTDKAVLEVSVALGESQSLSTSVQSGEEVAQTVGFVLQDDDVGDNIQTRVYEDPVWGTPLFLQELGSVTSDPWEGTNRAVDVRLELSQDAPVGPFDYRDGAHYAVTVRYPTEDTNLRSVASFLLYAPPADNASGVSVHFNGSAGPLEVELSRDNAEAVVPVSIYPPDIDRGGAASRAYTVAIRAEETEDFQISQSLELGVTFADLRAPRATVTAPYDGQRISPSVFTGDKPFKIGAFSDDPDVAKVQLERRNKQPDGVWSPWQIMSGLTWEKVGGANEAVTLVTHSDRDPVRRAFTFDWDGTAIAGLGVGEYQLRAVASDAATRLTDGATQEPRPNTDLDASIVTFTVDGSKPTVLTTIPDYQGRESERVYRGELSITFTDDMRADDFSDSSFEVRDLLDNNTKVAGFVSYSPALRKAVFVPVVTFQPNGFYRAVVKTDTDDGSGNITRGVRDLAGNPLDNTFVWTFRTTDAPFEEKWSIVLSVTDGADTDANNIAAVDFGALDGEDEKDARAVPSIDAASQLYLSFLDPQREQFDRDIRPADGRLSHHWFFMIGNATNAAEVLINWRPSLKLTRTTRQYQNIRLVEFDPSANVTNVLTLDPTSAGTDPKTGQINEIEAYRYTNAGEATRYFRLDVEKVGFVATTLQAGSTGWKFLSVPITPQRADPFVSFGDEIDPFQLFKYDTQLNGYKVYPLDIGEVSLLPGHGYFTRLTADVEVDVGGSMNQDAMTIDLTPVGWHSLGNPFTSPVAVESLQFSHKGTTNGFDAAVGAGWIEGTLYRWAVDVSSDMYEAVTTPTQDASATVTTIEPWDGNWLKTLQADLQITIPSPGGGAVAPHLVVGNQPSPASLQLPLPPTPAAPAVETAKASNRFDLRLELTSGFASDLTTVLGTQADANVGYDALDTSEPPTLGQTAAVYFDHTDWGESAGLYNRDYQPPLKVGEERTWRFVVFTDKLGAKMTLSWKQTIDQLPDDTMLYFRRANGNSPLADPDRIGRSRERSWKDMRQVQFVHLIADSELTKIPFEVRAERYEMSPPANLEAIDAGNQVLVRWTPDTNTFIDGYTIKKMDGNAANGKLKVLTPQRIAPSTHEFVDTKTELDTTYTYQIITHFKSGATLASDPLTLTTESPLKDLKVVAGEKQVKLQWKPASNTFINSYVVVRYLASHTDSELREAVRYTLAHTPDKPVSEYLDTQVDEEVDYTYQLEVVYQNDNRLKSDLFTVTVLPVIKETVLLQSYPNPFNPETWIPYELEKEADVTIEIYDATGRLVRALHPGLQRRGRYTSREKAAYWDGRNESGERTASGVYFYVMRAGDYYKTRKLVILK